MSILVLDNYDSFTYNLVHILRRIASEPVDVFRNDEIGPEEAKRYGRIVLSPGPGIPDEAGNLKAVIAACQDRPTLGVCLGHQAIAEFFGAEVRRAVRPMHGKVSEVEVLADDPLFSGLPRRFEACRYHSLVVGPCAGLEAIAVDPDGQTMAFRHETLAVRGVQYHPEAILTAHGLATLGNWAALHGLNALA